jgi:hypothetical protein
MPTDPMLYYLCLEYVGTGKTNATQVYIGVNHVAGNRRDERLRLALAAELAIFEPPGGPPPHATWLNRIAAGIILNACPPGDPASRDDRQRRVAALHGEIMRRWLQPSLASLPAGSGHDHTPQQDRATWEEYRETAEGWCKAHARDMACIFYDWASAYPNIDAKTDFGSLVDDLCCLWLAARNRGDRSVRC